MARSATSGRAQVTPVTYAPPGQHELDIELVDAAELRRRVKLVPDRGIERIDFHALIHVASGSYRHDIDFERHECRPGSTLVLRPGQVHAFGPSSRWTGWMVIFRTDQVAPVDRRGDVVASEFGWQLDSLPSHVVGDPEQSAAVTALCRTMAADAGIASPRRGRNALLVAQLRVLVLRLHLGSLAVQPQAAASPDVLERFRSFRRLVEDHFDDWHHVQSYARELGCSTKTLNRATTAVVDVSPKAFLVERIVLEARRLLAHSTMPVGSIGLRLGFDEPTNFVKFFRREVGETPGAFRSRVRARG